MIGLLQRVSEASVTVEGELDDISGAGQTEAAHDLCSSIPKAHSQHYTVPGAGHYGIFSGRRWRELAYPEVKAFIYAHNKPVAAASEVPAPAAPKVASKAASKTAPRSRAKVSPGEAK